MQGEVGWREERKGGERGERKEDYKREDGEGGGRMETEERKDGERAE